MHFILQLFVRMRRKRWNLEMAGVKKVIIWFKCEIEFFFARLGFLYYKQTINFCLLYDTTIKRYHLWYYK